MAESTAGNANTLTTELKKILTEIFPAGEGSSEADGVSGSEKSIDDAIGRIMTEFESRKKKKKPESQFPSQQPSSSVDFPKEFVCYLSNTIMNEPVVIASGLTYEKEYISDWLKENNTCPKSKQVLPHRLFTPNHLVDGLITRWFQANHIDRPKPSVETTTTVIELSYDAIDSLLNRVSTPISAQDQREAAREIRRQTKRFHGVRVFFVADSIARLIRPVTGDVGENTLDSSSELQEHIIATLFNISVLEHNNKKPLVVVAETPDVISLLGQSLRKGTVKTKRKAVGTLKSLLSVYSNFEIIGNYNSITFSVDLVQLIKEDDYLATTDAAIVLHIFCFVPRYRKWAILAGFITVLTNKVKAGTNVDVLLYVLALICVHEGILELIVKQGIISHLLSILRKQQGSVLDCESALNIVLSMCDMKTSKYVDDLVQALGEEEKKHKTLAILVKKSGSDVVVTKAKDVLQWLKRHRSGKKPVDVAESSVDVAESSGT